MKNLLIVLFVLGLAFSINAQDAKSCSADKAEAKKEHSNKFCEVPENTSEVQSFSDKQKGDGAVSTDGKKAAKGKAAVEKSAKATAEGKSCCSTKPAKTEKEAK